MKTIVVLVMLSFGLAAQAGVIRGQVMSVVSDDDGQKVILADKSDMNTAYLKNTHPSYEPLIDLIGLAKENKKTVLIQVDDEYMRFIKSIKVEK